MCTLTKATKVILISLVLLGISGLLLPITTDAQTPECNEEELADWLIQRQLGLNQLEDVRFIPYFEALKRTQEIRNEFETLPYPECAQELYVLTVLLYSGIVEHGTLLIHSGFPLCQNDYNNSAQKFRVECGRLSREIQHTRR